MKDAAGDNTKFPLSVVSYWTRKGSKHLRISVFASTRFYFVRI